MNPRGMSWKKLEESLVPHEVEAAMRGFFGKPSTDGSIEAVRYRIAELMGVDEKTSWGNLGEQLIIEDGGISGIPANDNIEIKTEGIYHTPIGNFSGEEVLQILATNKDNGLVWAQSMCDKTEDILKITFDGFRETMDDQVLPYIHCTVFLKYELSPKQWFSQYLTSTVLEQKL